MKRFALLIFSVGLLFTSLPSIGHSTVINELEAKRNNGGATSVTYEYPANTRAYLEYTHKLRQEWGEKNKK